MINKTKSSNQIIIGILTATLIIFMVWGNVNVEAQQIANYKLTPNDLIDFQVSGEPDLASVIRIAADGTAIFPLIGSLKVGGHSIPETTGLVTAKLKDGYLGQPQVNITVHSYAKKFFTVLGQVKNPGAYDFQGLDQITLLEAVGMAGGYTKTANASSVVVKRQDAGHEQVIKLNATRMARSNDSAAFMIKPGDIITVKEALF
jgi:polysaccharide export outer membrane protein